MGWIDDLQRIHALLGHVAIGRTPDVRQHSADYVKVSDKLRKDVICANLMYRCSSRLR